MNFFDGSDTGSLKDVQTASVNYKYLNNAPKNILQSVLFHKCEECTHSRLMVCMTNGPGKPIKTSRRLCSTYFY